MAQIAGIMWREGSGHGDYHEFTVRYVDRDHPITAGLADFQTWDELYHRLAPMMLATRFGADRVFH